MESFELELKRKLARREPSAGFTSRVMREIRRESASASVIRFPIRRPRPWRWTMVGAIAASLLVGALVQQDRRRDRLAAERAEAELVEALLVASTKLNKARDKAWGARAGGEKQ